MALMYVAQLQRSSTHKKQAGSTYSCCLCADHASGTEAISISINDVGYPVIQNDAPEFVCAVINEDRGSGIAATYSITAVASMPATIPVQTEQQALLNIYQAYACLEYARRGLLPVAACAQDHPSVP